MNTPLFIRTMLACAAIVLALAASPSTASVIPAFDFSDTTKWTPIAQGGVSTAALDIINKGFTISVPAVLPSPWAAGYETAFALQGDFTVDTDFLLEYWPQVNHMRIGITFLHPSQAAIERTSEGWGYDECYIFDGVGHGIVATDDMAGTLRLTRNGSTLAGYYLDDNKDWVYVGSGPVTTADAVIGFIAWPDYTGGGDVKVTFQNPVISTEGYLPGHPPAVPEPSTFIAAALLALPFTVQGIRRLRKR